MARFNFNLRIRKTKKTVPIYLIVRWGGNRLVYPTKERINPKFWNFEKQLVRETKQFPEYPEFNRRLGKIREKASNAFRTFQNDHDGRSPTISELKSELDSVLKDAPKGVDLFGFIDQFIDDSKYRISDKTGGSITQSTIRIYQYTRTLLADYASAKKKRVDFDTIELDFYYDFTAYLTEVKNLSNNTIGKHIKTLKTFLHEATEQGVNTNYNFRSKRFKTAREDTDSIYLTEEELNQIFELDLSNNKRLEKARDLFLVGCWTGLRFSDFTQISTHNIKGDFIEIKTQKTGRKVVIPIHKTVKDIMSRYNTHNNLPPSITNQKLNAYIKEVGEKVPALKLNVSFSYTKNGLKVKTEKKKYKLITTHTARRSFATNLYLAGVQTNTIMAITGHSTEKAFLRYIKVTPDEHAKILQRFWNNQLIIAE